MKASDLNNMTVYLSFRRLTISVNIWIRVMTAVYIMHVAADLDEYKQWVICTISGHRNSLSKKKDDLWPHSWLTIPYYSLRGVHFDWCEWVSGKQILAAFKSGNFTDRTLGESL